MVGGPSGAGKYPSISVADLLALLERPSTGSASALQTICLKCELVVSFGLVQLQLEENERDSGWREVLQDGSLRRAVEAMFEADRQAMPTDAQSKELVRTKRDAVLAIISTW